MYVCLYVRVFVCMYVSIYVCMCVCIVCMCVYMYVCVFVCMYVCIYVCMCLRVAAHRLHHFLLMVAMHNYYYCILAGASPLQHKDKVPAEGAAH